MMGMVFLFPSRSRIIGMFFFIPFPFPNLGNGFFQFPSRSHLGNGIIHSRSRSQTPKCHSRSPLGDYDDVGGDDGGDDEPVV